jgi:acyl dehydratase
MTGGLSVATYFEELEPGNVYDHPFRRTVTEFDNVIFTSLTMNPQPLHLDEEFAKSSIYGTRIVNSLFTLALVISFSTYELTMGTTLGNLGFEKVSFPRPVTPGDTLRGRTEVLRRRESRSRPTAGLVWFRHVGYNQRDEVVCECERVGMMMRRPK